jgi:hypothetical protein
MAKNQEFVKYANDITEAQDNIRSANEELIKLSQRLGRMMPKLSKLDTSGIVSWFKIYNKIKDGVGILDDSLKLIQDDESVNSNSILQSQLTYYLGQKARVLSKMEVMDDILGGIIEDLLENNSFEEFQREEIRMAFQGTMEKSRTKVDPMPIMA